VLCTGALTQDQVALTWCRATGELDDAAAMLYAVKVEPVRVERAVRPIWAVTSGSIARGRCQRASTVRDGCGAGRGD
jgi:hypothetical protein